MSALIEFPRALPVANAKPVDPYLRLPQFARTEAERRLSIIQPALTRIADGASVPVAAKWLATGLSEDISCQTLASWIRMHRKGGITALAPKYKGKERKVYGWEARAIELYNQPQRPYHSTVAIWLRQEGHASASYHLVHRFLEALPSHQSETSPKRLGQHFYQQNVRPYIVRDTSVLPVGFIYQGDGHCCDVYVAAPATGMPYRPELTAWMDVRSHYITGWWLSESESAITTLYSFSNALLSQDHTPAMAHTDPGSGFTARVIADSETGFFARFDIEVITALPGNAKGKGLIEGWFRWFEERLGKRFETFCGHCRTDDELRALTQKVKRGDVRLPTLAEYAESIREFIRFYNNNPQDDLGGLSPAELWAQLERVPLETSAAAIMRPRERRTVRRWGVEHQKRLYRAAELQSYESREVTIEYDLHDDSMVRVFDDKGRYVCDADLVEKQAWLPASRIEEAQQRRLVGQQKRLQIKADEAAARARSPLSAFGAIDALEGNAPEPLPEADHGLSMGYEVPVQRQPRPVRIERPIDQDEHARIADALAPVAVDETPEQRFGRALRLQKLIDRNLLMDHADAQWLVNYTQSAECQGFTEIFNSFGYVPGVETDTDHTTKEPTE